MLTATFVFVALAAIIFSMKPLYSAKTTLVFPYNPVSELVHRNEISSSPQSDPLIIHSYLQMLKDDGICLQVIRQLHLAGSPDFDPAPNVLSTLAAKLSRKLLHSDGIASDAVSAREDRALRIYKKRLKIDGGRSLAAELTFDARQPELAAAIVNAHANAYLVAQVQYRRREADVKTAWMEEQVQQSANGLRSAQIALQLHRASPRTTSLGNASETAELQYLQAILNSKQSSYDSLLSRQQVLLAEQNYGGSDTRILSPARPSPLPSFPNKPLFGAVSAFAAVLTGLGAAWLADWLMRRHRSTRALVMALGLEQLAMVEIPRRWALPFGSLRKLRLAVFWERMREVRSSLGAWQKGGLVLAVTSATSGQSSSLVAASLARVVAVSGTPTLLLDLDLRHPSAHTFFGLTVANRCGLEECIAGRASFKEVIRKIADCENLAVLGCSVQNCGDIDMLAGPVMNTLMDDLRREYKVVIINTPPMGVVSDTLVIADLADEIVLVAENENYDGVAMETATSSLRRRSAEIRGVVLTSRRQLGSLSCRTFKAFKVNDKLSEMSPLPFAKRRSVRKIETVLEPGVLQAAE